MKTCKTCQQGDTPKLLDRHGVIKEKSDEPETVMWCHAYDIYWWPCGAPPNKRLNDTTEMDDDIISCPDSTR